jgi:hypothetical protein
VALVIGFDAVSNKVFHRGARKAIHYATPAGARYIAGSGFKGQLRNVKVQSSRVNHFNIDENRQVQTLALQDIRAAVRKNR